MSDVVLVEATDGVTHVDSGIGGSVEEYRAYLEGRGVCEVVGWSGDEADCPVKNFLAERHAEEIYVEEYLVFKGDEVWDSQRWMDFHVRLVDREDGAITAGLALRLLDASEAERAACAEASAKASADAAGVGVVA